MLAVIVFVIILGLLIFVHEAGHFIAARKSGMKAEEFGFGFPPRIMGFVRNVKTGKLKYIPGNKRVVSQNTLYSINWIPLGGFVKIKGENGENEIDEDSFSAKPAWKRIVVLIAGVTMNFVFGWILISLALMVGSPQPLTDQTAVIGRNPKIQVSQVVSGSPAEEMGLQVGDEVYKCGVPSASGDIPDFCKEPFNNINQVQEFIDEHRGSTIFLFARRGDELKGFEGVPRVSPPENEGALGIGMMETVIVSYPPHKAVWLGLLSTLGLIKAIVIAFGLLIKGLIVGSGISADISGPIGIAYFTKQVTDLGLSYILQFAAILSINLGIINILPFPALDGGRVIFILIEKFKGSPVSQKIEQAAHTVGFAALILLMVVVTFRDVMKFDIFDKILNIF